MPRVEYKPLCEAISQGDINRLKTLSAEDPAAAVHWKPITDAAFKGSADAIRVLVDHGADVNVVSGTGSRHTPLTRLCQYHSTIPKHAGHVTALEQLLEFGADPDVAAGPLNLRPMCYATMGPLESLVACLQNVRQLSDLWDAAVLCDIDRLRTLAKDRSLNVRDDVGRTPLHYVALSGMYKVLGSDVAIECADCLLGGGIEVDAMQPIPDGSEVFNANALWYSVSWQNHFEMAKHLLEKGASPQPAVFAALWSSDLTICELLDQYGADWDQQFDGMTPLMEMIRYNRVKLIPWLLDKGVDTKVRNNEGQTALDVAVKRKLRAELIELLA